MIEVTVSPRKLAARPLCLCFTLASLIAVTAASHASIARPMADGSAFRVPTATGTTRCALRPDEAAIYAVIAAHHIARIRDSRVSEVVIVGSTREDPTVRYPAMGLDRHSALMRVLQPSTLASFKKANKYTTSLAGCRLSFAVPHTFWIKADDPQMLTLRPSQTRLSLEFSRVGFSKDRTQAFLYSSYLCGGLCGEGFYAVLKRTDDGWVIVDSSITWIA